MDEQIKEVDMVNHPPHYEGKYECIDVMLECFGAAAVQNFCICNAFKYMYRCCKKMNKIQDIEKAQWYLNKYLEIENNSTDYVCKEFEKLEEIIKNNGKYKKG